MKQITLIIFISLFSVFVTVQAANVSVHKNEQTGLLTYTSESEGFSIELIQLLPDFVRAVYAKHDFPKSEIERIANYCVFGSIVKTPHSNSYTTKWLTGLTAMNKASYSRLKQNHNG